MRITSMTVENFLSFGKAEFDFEDAGLVLVEGENQDDESARSNGSGKSAMIDALVWCLFGTTLRGYENDEVVHRKVGEDCLVMVDFEKGDEKYRVSRARRHSKWKNALTLSTQGADVSAPSVAETQALVEEVLGCSKRTFLSSVVFGQDRAYRFSSLTDKDQKEILDEVLGVERFARACNAARAQVAVIEAGLDVTQRDLDKAERSRDEADGDVTELQKKDEAYSTEHEGKVKAEKEKLKKAKTWLKENDDVDTAKLRSAWEKAQREVGEAETAVDKMTKAEAKATGLLVSGKAEIDKLRKHIKSHEDLAGDCPTCGQKIDAKQQGVFARDLKKKLVELESTFDKATNAAKEITERVAEQKKLLKDARARSVATQEAFNEGSRRNADANAARERIKTSQQRLAELDDEVNPYVELLKKAQARLKKHTKEAELLTTQVAAEEARLKLAKFWVQAYGARGLRSLLLDSSLPLLNAEAEKVSRAVTGGSIDIEFSATSELKSGKTIDRFEVKVDNRHGAGSYQGNSAGEKAKVDLCVGLALQRLVASRSPGFNVCFFDEVFDHLDQAAHERVVDVLAEIDKESVFVVSHDEDLKAWFPASLTVVKKDGFSSVET